MHPRLIYYLNGGGVDEGTNLSHSLVLTFKHSFQWKLIILDTHEKSHPIYGIFHSGVS